MSVEENKAVVLRFVAEVWNGNDPVAFDELVAQDHVHHSSRQTPDREGLKDILALGRAAFPDIKFTVDDIFGEGDRVLVRATVRGTHSRLTILEVPPSGKVVVWTGLSVFRLRDGQIVEGWYEWDTLNLLQQLGVISQVLPVPI
jgi:steroid delta-isomerase-like uncharacterized protein